jgi:hypothetical protein
VPPPRHLLIPAPLPIKGLNAISIPRMGNAYEGIFEILELHVPHDEGPIFSMLVTRERTCIMFPGTYEEVCATLAPEEAAKLKKFFDVEPTDGRIEARQIRLAEKFPAYRLDIEV